MAAFSSIASSAGRQGRRKPPGVVEGDPSTGWRGIAVPRGTAIGGDIPPVDTYSNAAAAASAARGAAVRQRKAGAERNVLTKLKPKTTGKVPAALTPRTLIGASY